MSDRFRCPVDFCVRLSSVRAAFCAANVKSVPLAFPLFACKPRGLSFDHNSGTQTHPTHCPGRTRTHRVIRKEKRQSGWKCMSGAWKFGIMNINTGETHQIIKLLKMWIKSITKQEVIFFHSATLITFLRPLPIQRAPLIHIPLQTNIICIYISLHICMSSCGYTSIHVSALFGDAQIRLNLSVFFGFFSCWGPNATLKYNSSS